MVDEFPDQKQRGGVCGTAWRDKEKSAAARKLQGRLDFQGLSISIENRKGGVREGVDSDGTEWRTKMKHRYGYIKGTIGADGEHVDCFVGPDENAEKAYVIHIKNPETDKYDEDKVMLGFSTKEEAEASFRRHYDNPGKYLLSIDTMTIDELKARFETDKEKGRRTRMLKAAEEAFFDGFIDTLVKSAAFTIPDSLPDDWYKQKGPNIRGHEDVIRNARMSRRMSKIPGAKQVKALRGFIRKNPLEALTYASLASLALMPVGSYLGGYNAEVDRHNKKEAGAGTMAASILIPSSMLATVGASIGALANKDNRGKGALIGAGIGGGMGVAGGIPIGRSISRILANNKTITKDLNRKAHDMVESLGQSFGKGTAQGVKKELNPLSIFKKQK